MRFEKEVEVKGIPAYRFTPPRDVLASGKNNPENEGFCVTPKKCLDDGVLDVSVCRKGAVCICSCYGVLSVSGSCYAVAIVFLVF